MVNFYNNLIKGQVKSPILYTMRDKLFMFLTFRTVKKLWGKELRLGLGNPRASPPCMKHCLLKYNFGNGNGVGWGGG